MTSFLLTFIAVMLIYNVAKVLSDSFFCGAVAGLLCSAVARIIDAVLS